MITYDEIKEKINTKLNEAMDAAITYQDKSRIVAMSFCVTRGCWGSLYPVQISGISYDVITYDGIKKIITTKLNEGMDAAITYQDKFTSLDFLNFKEKKKNKKQSFKNS